jgi:hypothetical protein
MARPRTDQRVIAKITDLAVNTPKQTAGKVRLDLERWAKQTGYEKPLPSVRQVARELSKLRPHVEKIEAGGELGDLANFKHFYFPESMERGELPWEAAPAALELLEWGADIPAEGEDESYRPTIASVRWFWRVSIAAPDAPLDTRIHIATSLEMLSLRSDVTPEAQKRVIEACLLHHIWRPHRHDWETRLLKVRNYLQKSSVDETWQLAEAWVNDIRNAVEVEAGLKPRTIWRAEVTDPEALVRHLVEHPDLWPLLKINYAALREAAMKDPTLRDKWPYSLAAMEPEVDSSATATRTEKPKRRRK